jgi:hypothetical protein
VRIANRNLFSAVRTLCANGGPVRAPATGKVQQQTNEFNNNDHQRKQRGTWHFLLSGFEALIEQRRAASYIALHRPYQVGIDSLRSCSSAMCSAMITWRCTRTRRPAPMQSNTQPLGDAANENGFSESHARLVFIAEITTFLSSVCNM